MEQPFGLLVENLQKNWQNFSIDLSFKIKKGETLAITGPSGCGKSSLLRLLCGLLKSDDGKIFVNDDEVTHKKPALRKIGLIFQRPVIFPHLNVLDNAAYALLVRGMAKKEAREIAAEFLEKIGLENFSRLDAKTLSGGEAQRINIARMLILRPEVVLFDEPFSALDLPLQEKLRNQIAELQSKTGWTSILVSHSIEEILRFSQNALVMKSGREFWQGDSQNFSRQILDECYK